jgi:hypothetical protein
MDDNRSPKHGTNPEPGGSVSQPDGSAADAPRGETQAQPNRSNRDTTQVNSQTPENRQQQINPSAPTESTEGGHVTEQLVSRGPSTRDAFGEVGHPSGKGTLEVDERTISTGDDPTPHKPGPEGTGQPRNRKKEEPAA